MPRQTLARQKLDRTASEAVPRSAPSAEVPARRDDSGQATPEAHGRASSAIEDYLKAVQLLEWENGDGLPVTTTAVAGRLGVSPASATNMLKKLDRLGLANHVPYRGTTLTPPGRSVALEMIRHHRLLETYLSEALGVPWDEVHQEAEVLEHVLSEGLEDRIAALLGHPDSDPHGHPIPAKDGTLPDASRFRLWDMADGETRPVDRVSDTVAEALRHLGSLGLRPGAIVEVVGRGPVDGPLYVRVPGGADGVHALSKALAEAIWVA